MSVESTRSVVNTDQLKLKLKNAVERLREKLNSEDSTEIYDSISTALNTFKDFYTNIDTSEFNPTYFQKGDPARSDDYNKNLSQLDQDISRFYTDINNLLDNQVASYNYTQISTQEIINRANQLASTVLDLNILNNFTRGDTIVAGDDFKSLDFVDQQADIASEMAELTSDGGGMGLARSSTRDLMDERIEVEVFPIGPSSENSSKKTIVNTKPTPHNLERFYEGNYYNMLGLARPEGGKFNLQYVLDPEDETNSRSSAGTQGDDKDQGTGDKLRDAIEKSAKKQGHLVGDRDVVNEEGYIIDYGASEDQKKLIRLRMLDGNPSTFWECEYLYRVRTPLLGDVFEKVVENDDETETGKDIFDGLLDSNNDSPNLDRSNAPQGGHININLEQADKVAQAYDFEGRDLIVDVIITFPEVRNVNFIQINPVIFSTQAFPAVDEISTSTGDEGQFILIDGWNRLKFPKTITPEANEYLTDSQLGATLAPSRYEYAGQGIYPFPVRRAKRIKLRLRVNEPSAQVYERTSVLLKKVVNIDGTITTKTKKGLFA